LRQEEEKSRERLVEYLEEGVSSREERGEAVTILLWAPYYFDKNYALIGIVGSNTLHGRL